MDKDLSQTQLQHCYSIESDPRKYKVLVTAIEQSERIHYEKGPRKHVSARNHALRIIKRRYRAGIYVTLPYYRPKKRIACIHARDKQKASSREFNGSEHARGNKAEE